MNASRRHTLTGLGLSCLSGLAVVLASACSSSTNDTVSGPDGATTTDDSGTQTDSSTSDGGTATSLLGFTPSNVDVSMIDTTGVSDVVMGDGTIETDGSGVFQGTYKYIVLPQASGPSLGVFVVKSLSIPAGVKVTAEGKNALVILALDSIDIAGTLDANSQGSPFFAGPGQLGTPSSSSVGLGAGGGGAGTVDSSGGGGAFCGKGGAGSSVTGAAAAGGMPYGNATLIPLLAGSTGGAGFGISSYAGGAVQLIARTSITVDGVITVGATGGGPAAFFAGHQQASGGGSGGAILLESATVAVTGTLAANGGAGGEGSDGVSGMDGQPNATAATANDGTHGSPGGTGSAGTTIAGGDGTADPNTNGGAGGGGAGWIRINTLLGQASLSGTLSPSVTTSCVSQGKVSP